MTMLKAHANAKGETLTRKLAVQALNWFLAKYGLEACRPRLFCSRRPPKWAEHPSYPTATLGAYDSKQNRIWIRSGAARPDEAPVLRRVFHQCAYVKQHADGQRPGAFDPWAEESGIACDFSQRAGDRAEELHAEYMAEDREAGKGAGNGQQGTGP